MISTVNRICPVSERAVEEYRQTLADDGEALPMLKTLKLLRAIIVSIGIISITLYAIDQGGNATVLGLTGLFVLGAYSGLEYSDYLAMLQAYQDVQAASDQSESSDTSE